MIIVVLASLISFVTSFYVPLPYNFVIYVPLLVVLAKWRIRKKGVTGKEFITIILILAGLSGVSSIVIPWPFSYLASVALLFLVIWALHQRAIK